jgi:hypothetical protein
MGWRILVFNPELASMTYFDFDMSNSATKVVYLEDSNLYLRLRKMSKTIYAPKFEQTITHQHTL